jgi:D-galactarolactone cycloisomerase
MWRSQSRGNPLTITESSDDDRSAHFSIRSIRSVLLSHRYPEGEELRWVGGVIKSWDAALVEITLEDGTTGLGEVGAGIMAAAAVPGIVDALEPYVVGAVFDGPLEVGDYLRTRTLFWARGGISSGVIGAVEIACIDAVGKRQGIPAYEVMGGRHRDEIRAYASGGLGSTFDEVRTWAETQAAAGFGTVKFRAMKDAETTLDLLSHVVPRLPSGVGFVLDAVQGSASATWSTEDAIRVGQAAAALGAQWFEEPAAAGDPIGYARVREAISCRVSGVESYSLVSDFERLFELDAVDIAQPDVSLVGGAAAFLKVAERANGFGLDTVPHVWGSGVTLAANLHTSLASPFVGLFEYCTLPNPLRQALLVHSIDAVDGFIGAPTAPGLGVILSEEIENAYPFAPGAGHVIR